MELKRFQHEALDTLERFLNRARSSNNPEQAFREVWQERNPDTTPPPYRIIPNLPDVPNVCLRLPTGGGKTLLAAHTVALAGRAYLEKDFPVVLWLVPTTIIRKQTAEALKKPSHPYRAALDDAFEGRVSVFDVEEIDNIRPHDLTERVAVIVCTIQTLRVSNSEGRRAYAHSETFEPHFARVSPTTPGLERAKDGTIKFSFVNLMAVHRPLVIVDEAHKAGTKLSFDMLAALRPSCIVEFTATPNLDPTTGSNVLFHASAAEVKAADMIKLPIILTEHSDWRSAVHGALETRARLAEVAKEDTSYIRPLVLFQAQDKGRDVTVDVLKTYLLESEGLAPEAIAVATGEQRELDSINLFDPTCRVTCIITVEALKEGWDCSFAYVLCSVANIGSATDIEQLLGRVLRMPEAKKRASAALNQAYCHVSSPRFGEAAEALKDALIKKMGFEPGEAATQLRVQPEDLPGFHHPQGDLLRRSPMLVQTVDKAPDLSGLPDDVTANITVNARPDGTVDITVKGEVPSALEDRLLATASTSAEREALKSAVNRQRLAHLNSLSPAERGERFPVPRLFLNVQGELELAEEEVILDLGGWSLNDDSAALSEAEFSIRETAQRWEVDLRGEKVTYSHLDQNAQQDIGILKLDITDLGLSRWLDRETLSLDVHPNDILQPVRLEFCRKAVAALLDKRGFSLQDLVRFKHPLAKALHQKIKDCRLHARAKSYQMFLMGPTALVETRFVGNFSFHNRPYPAAWAYTGAYRFKKHFFGTVGELEAKGEEFECAKVLDTVPEVKHWVRNLATRRETSFWLLTSTDRFYPDFVAELTDGRILVVEYKGADRATNDDTKEKQNVGELWAAKSGGKALFLMAVKRDDQGRDVRAQISAAVE